MTRIARFAARRHRLVLIGALLAFLALAVVGVGAFGSLGDAGQSDPNSASYRAAGIIDQRFGGTPGLVVLVSAEHGTVDTAATETVGRRVTARLQARHYVSDLTSYFTTHATALRSTDRRSALVLARSGPANADKANPELPDLITSLQNLSTSTVSVEVGGEDGTNSALTAQIGNDLRLVSIVAVPITLVLLFFVFGGLLAALLPLAISALAIMGTFATLHVLTFVTEVSTYAIDLNIALGLGLAVDYGLLYVTRYREERAGGADVADALATTSATAGRTILFSGVTVALALTALLVFPVYFLRSFGYAGIAVVVFAVIGALLVLPALLAALGDRVATRRHRRDRRPRRGFWRAVANTVTARPVATGLPVLIVLLLVGLPLLHVRFASPDDRSLRSSATAHQVGDTLRTRFASSSDAELSVVAESDRSTSPQALDRYSIALSVLPGARDVQGPSGVYRDGRRVGDLGPGSGPHSAGDDHYWVVDNDLDPTGAAATTLVRGVRAVAAPAGSTVLVGGNAASLVDQKHSIAAALPWAAGILVVVSLLMLFLFTGSVIIPIKALVLNALTLFTVIGAMIWIFQGGHLSGLLGFTPTDTTITMPPLLFVIAFALSMDYEVFLISRIKELHDHGRSNTEAVVEGMARTGSVVTTAAALLCITFFAFGLSKISFLQFFGIGTGLAILLDAFIVRGVLVPGVMQLLGERSWWAPRPLRALHQRVALSDA